MTKVRVLCVCEAYVGVMLTTSYLLPSCVCMCHCQCYALPMEFLLTRGEARS